MRLQSAVDQAARVRQSYCNAWYVSHIQVAVCRNTWCLQRCARWCYVALTVTPAGVFGRRDWGGRLKGGTRRIIGIDQSS